ncbi:MAG: UDP-glucose/GDP-mannose dehydrogenase family protein [Planctomycetales bacterium]|nr:UDP-glucose/GDP-mannose dehydrogenase family protein [Planctomycetales bacterium]
MKISVFGLGYVGSVSAGCLARDGHHVIGVDVNSAKVDALVNGRSLVSEPGLSELVAAHSKTGRLRATTDGFQAVLATDMSLICVGTPSNSNGSLNLDYIEAVCREIGTALGQHSGYHLVCVRSTVLPGTTRNMVMQVLEQQSGKRAGTDFGLCMNPEFLREGCAIADYQEPSQIVMGGLDEKSSDIAMQMYDGIDALRIRTTLETAESVKYACNTFHALKVAYANEIGNICQAHNVDGQEVMRIFCNDRKLNVSEKYLLPGFAFGGSCLPKDCRALVYRAKEKDVETPLLRAVLESNQMQIERSIRMVEQTDHKRIGVLGLSFKSGTDDVRESPVIVLVETLVGRGYDVQIYDPNVKPEELFGANRSFLAQTLPHVAKLMQPDVDALVANCDVLVVTNGSEEFRQAVLAADGSKMIIDLHGITKHSKEYNGNYKGICW